MKARTRLARGFTLIELLARRPKPLDRHRLGDGGWRRQGQSAFTLIELLVVITVIGMLASILIPSIRGALKSAKRARAMSQIRDLEGAVKRYFAEYNRMPVPAGQMGQVDKLFTGADQAKVVELLINSPKRADTNQNPKQIVFLDLDPASFLGTDGKPLKSVEDMQDQLAGGTPYKDPWGNDYGILMDLNFDEKIAGTSGGFVDIRAKVAVYSGGEDGNVNEPPYKTW